MNILATIFIPTKPTIAEVKHRYDFGVLKGPSHISLLSHHLHFFFQKKHLLIESVPVPPSKTPREVLKVNTKASQRETDHHTTEKKTRDQCHMVRQTMNQIVLLSRQLQRILLLFLLQCTGNDREMQLFLLIKINLPRLLKVSMK